MESPKKKSKHAAISFSLESVSNCRPELAFA